METEIEETYRSYTFEEDGTRSARAVDVLGAGDGTIRPKRFLVRQIGQGVSRNGKFLTVGHVSDRERKGVARALKQKPHARGSPSSAIEPQRDWVYRASLDPYGAPRRICEGDPGDIEWLPKPPARPLPKAPLRPATFLRREVMIQRVTASWPWRSVGCWIGAAAGGLQLAGVVVVVVVAP